MKTDLFACLVLNLDESLKKIRKITKKFEFSQFGFKKPQIGKRLGLLISFLGFEPVTQYFNHLEDRLNSLNFQKTPI